MTSGGFGWGCLRGGWWFVCQMWWQIQVCIGLTGLLQIHVSISNSSQVNEQVVSTQWEDMWLHHMRSVASHMQASMKD